MGDRALIFGGLALFLLVVTLPVWKGLAAQTTTAGPEVSKPAGKKECVASRDYMRSSHMELLVAWRDGKVREGRRTYTAAGGQVYAISLRGTCLDQCHGSSEKFCDRCHSFAGVPATGCWACHPAPPGGSSASAGQQGGRI